MKKILTLFVAALCVVCAWAQDSGTGWVLSEDGVLTISGDDAWNDKGWLKRGPGVIEVKRVIIEDGVTRIGSGAFWYCSKLESVSIAETVIEIERDAFNNCVKLTNIVIPNSVTTMGDAVFEDCENLEGVTLSDNLTSIDEYTFSWCVNLKSVVIPESVTSIGYRAFNRCDALTSLFIPKNVSSIGDLVLYGDINVESIVVDDDNEYYDSRENCNAIIEIATNRLIAGCENTVIPNGVKSIGYGVFQNCGITEVVIPEGVEVIDHFAFCDCEKLTKLTLPEGLKSIRDDAFANSRLTSVTIPSSVDSLGYAAFAQIDATLTSVIMKSATPPAIDELVFYTAEEKESDEDDYIYYVIPNLKIFVPKGSLDAYKEKWAEYADVIFEMVEPTAIETISEKTAGKALKTIENGRVVIVRNGVRYDIAGLKL